MDVFSLELRVFPETEKLRFDCAGASALRYRPLIFSLCASTFTLPFLHHFLMVFRCSLGIQIHDPKGVGDTGGSSLLQLTKAHSESSLYHRARSAPALLPTA